MPTKTFTRDEILDALWLEFRMNHPNEPTPKTRPESKFLLPFTNNPRAYWSSTDPFYEYIYDNERVVGINGLNTTHAIRFLADECVWRITYETSHISGYHELLHKVDGEYQALQVVPVQKIKTVWVAASAIVEPNDLVDHLKDALPGKPIDELLVMVSILNQIFEAYEGEPKKSDRSD